MRYPRILSAIRSARWAVAPATLQAITDTLGAHLRGQLHATLESAKPVVAPQFGPGVIAVHGIIGKHLSGLEVECGGCDVDIIGEALAAAVADPSITSVLLDFDSPGGTVTGVPELAAKIREAAGKKPVYAYTSGQCCSAAYWLAAAARKVYCAPSSDLGSIGVYIALLDDSEWWQKQGYKLELIKAGEYKAMGISGQPLADAERALLQADVDQIYELFTSDIRLTRPLTDEVMQGQTFLGINAVKAGLADALYADREEVLRLMATVG
jgi:signal peptide peptidase SppA